MSKDFTRVLVDVDDTISDTQLVLLETVNTVTGNNYRFEEMTREYRSKEFLSNADAKAAARVSAWGDEVRATLNKPEIMASCAPSERALEAMADLHENCYEIHIVSARQKPLHSVTADWLATHGFADFVHSIHPRPWGESGTEFKVRVANEVGFEIAYEDTWEVAAALAGVIDWVYLIDKPWNRGHDYGLPDNVERVASFAQGVDTELMPYRA